MYHHFILVDMDHDIEISIVFFSILLFYVICYECTRAHTNTVFILVYICALSIVVVVVVVTWQTKFVVRSANVIQIVIGIVTFESHWFLPNLLNTMRSFSSTTNVDKNNDDNNNHSHHNDNMMYSSLTLGHK